MGCRPAEVHRSAGEWLSGDIRWLSHVGVCGFTMKMKRHFAD